MKRRTRLNKKIAIIFTAIVVAAGIGAMVARKWSERPEKYIKAGDSFMDQGNYEKAAQNYAAAFGAGKQRDLDLLMKQGEAWYKLGVVESAYMPRALACWQKALEINHDFVAASRRLLAFWEQQVSVASPEQRPKIYGYVREYAQRVAEADPNDKAAAAKIPMTIVQSWLVGVATESKVLEDSLTQLRKLQLSNPGDAEIPTVLAQADLRKAQDAMARNDQPNVDKFQKSAAAIFDTALKGQDSNTEMHLRAASIYNVLGRSASDKKMRVDYASRAKVEVDKVRSLAKAGTPKYTETMMSVGMLLQQQGDQAGAEAVLGDLVAQVPDDQSARLAYAHALASDPAKKQKAIQVLTAAAAPGQGGNNRRLETAALFELCNLQLQTISEAKTPADRDALVKQIEANLARMSQGTSDNPGILRIRGQLQLLTGHETDAIQTLSKAQQMLRQQAQSDDQLTYILATAYLSARQTGEAKNLLGQLVAVHPGFAPARRMLAQIFIQENNPDQAEPHVAALETIAPNEPDVIRLRIALDAKRGQSDQAIKLYARLPETNSHEKVAKAMVAIGLEKSDDAVRLLEDVYKENPKDLTVIRPLVTAYRAHKDLTSARKVIDDAIAVYPTDLSLVALRRQLQGVSTPEESQRFTREMAEKNPDPYTREIQLAAVSGDEGKDAEVVDHLKKAEQIKPDEKQVQEALFQTYLREGKWDLAGQYGDKLAKADADRAGGRLYKFRLLMAQEKFPDALVVAQDLSGKMPEFAQSWVTLALAQQATGHTDAAVQSYLRALEKQSDNGDAMRGLIDCYYRQNRPDDAQRYITLARRTFPNNAYFRELELRHALQFGDPEQAVAQWEAAQKQHPEIKSNSLSLAQAYWRATTDRAVQGDQAGVKKYSDLLANLMEAGIKQWPEERLFYAYLADLASLRHDPDAGVQAIRRLTTVEAWKDKPEPLMMLGEYYTHFRKYPEAEAAFREAMTKTTDDTAPRQELADVLAQQGKIEDAVKILEPKSDNPVVMRQRLRLLVSAHRLDTAEKLALDLLAKDPKSNEIHNSLLLIYLEGARYDNAMDQANQVLAQDPTNAMALYGRGMVNLHRAKPDVAAAIRDLKAARDKDPQNMEARYWLAEAYRMSNDWDSAVRELDQAVKAQPANKAIRLKMAQFCADAVPPRWVDAERVLREGRAIPALATDPDLAIAEARMWIARREPDQAVQVAQQSLAVNAGNSEVVRVYLDALLAAGQYQALLTGSDKLAEQPNSPYWIYVDRAVAKRRLDQKDAALAEFEKALNSSDVQQHDELAGVVLNRMAEELGIDEALAQVAPKVDSNPRWRLVQAYLYQQKKDYASAIASVEKLTPQLDKMSPDQRVNALRFAGSLYLMTQPQPQAEKALAAFKRSLQDFPDDSSVLNNVASILTDYISPARPEEALQYSQHAYDLMKKTGRVDPLILDTQGRVLTMLNRLDEGIVLLQDAADRTTIPDVHYHLAEAYMKKQAPEEARKHLIQASATIEKMKKDQQPVDASMVAKIDQLSAQAKKMIDSKAQAGAR